MTKPLLRVDGLTIGVQKRGGEVLPVVDSVSLALPAGGSLGIAGESGSGKSTLLLALMGIVKPGLSTISGEVLFDGLPMFGSSEPDLEKIRGGRLALIPQNAGTALTPTLRIGAQIEEALRLHSPLGPSEHLERTVELLSKVRLPNPREMVRRFPHELSGGQVQRAAIAMALAGEPEMLLLDEPTTGLDVTTQLGILELLGDLRRESGVAVVCVSHDLGVLARLTDTIAVMYAGSVVEEGSTAALLSHPAHPYTGALIGSIPRLSSAELPVAIPGRPPALDNREGGCRFEPRCSRAESDCRSRKPDLAASGTGGRVACFHPLAADRKLSGEVNTGARATTQETSKTALSLESVSISYGKRRMLQRFLPGQRSPATVKAVSFELRRGEVLGLVGESGSGKSTILRAISGLWPMSEGRVRLTGEADLSMTVEGRDREKLRVVQLVFQNPDASLNPRHTVEEILAQPLRLYFRLGDSEIRTRAGRLLADVRLDERYLSRYPGQLSGGERQRIAIARAFAAEPDILLCDEVTSALDVSVQASVLRLLRDLSTERGVSTILVSHDLAVVQALADRIAVLYRGHLVEIGPARDVCGSSLHPYTRALVAAVLEPEPISTDKQSRVRDHDDVASTGCPFAGRCTERLDVCVTAMPGWNTGIHQARCHLLLAERTPT